MDFESKLDEVIEHSTDNKIEPVEFGGVHDQPNESMESPNEEELKHPVEMLSTTIRLSPTCGCNNGCIHSCFNSSI